MYILPGYLLTEPLCQHHPELRFHLKESLRLINIKSDHSSSAPVKLYEPFLFQNAVRLIYSMHVNPHSVRQPPHRRQGIPLPQQIHGYPHDDLILQLDIYRLVTVKINLYVHYTHLFFCSNVPDTL